MINKKFVGTQEFTVSISGKDLNVLCNTGKYSIAHNFEDYLNLESDKEIALIRKEFGEDAKLLLAYVIGLCEDNAGDDEKVNTIPYGNLDIQVKVVPEEGVVLHWIKEIN